MIDSPSLARNFSSEETMNPVHSSTCEKAIHLGKSLGGAAISGSIIYCLNRLANRMGGVDEKEPIFGPCLIFAGVAGVVSSVIIEGASLISTLFFKILGDQQEIERLPSKSASDRLRQHTWKVVHGVEKFEEKVDKVFSHIFHIRTAKEIRENKLKELDLAIMEILRRAFFEQVQDTMKTSVPQELGIYAVEAWGYTIIGGHVGLFLHGVSFLLGLSLKINLIYNKSDAQEKELEAQEARL